MLASACALLLTGLALADPPGDWRGGNPYSERVEATQASSVTEGGDPFHWEVEPPALYRGQVGQVQLRLVVPPGLVVYRDQLEVQVLDAGGLQVSTPDFPPGLIRANPVDGADLRELYDMDVIVDLPVTATASTPSLADMQVFVAWQGCRKGLCYPPSQTTLEVLVPVRSGSGPAPRLPLPLPMTASQR